MQTMPALQVTREHFHHTYAVHCDEKQSHSWALNCCVPQEDAAGPWMTKKKNRLTKKKKKKKEEEPR